MIDNKQRTYIIPGAIIVAGLLIAAAIIYSPTPSPQQIVQPDDRQEGAEPGLIPEKNGEVSIDVKNWPSKGAPNAPVLMVEYSDFACSFCARFWEQTLPEIQKEYIDTGKVRFVYKNFIAAGGDRAAEAAHCAAEQGKFWEYYDILYSRLNEDRGKWGDPNIHRGYAQELGLNVNDLVRCFEERRYQDKVQASIQEGAENGVTGTPTFFVNDKMIIGAQPFQVFQEAIDRELGNR